MSSPGVYRCPLAYVFIEGKQVARDKAYLVLKTETGSSPALATRRADIPLPTRHTLLVYVGNSTEPKVRVFHCQEIETLPDILLVFDGRLSVLPSQFSVLLTTSKETPARADPLPLIRYSHQRQYLLIYNELGSTQVGIGCQPDSGHTNCVLRVQTATSDSRQEVALRKLLRHCVKLG